MATHWDQEIEQLEHIVEKCLDLCHATWNGTRCTLPANHESTQPHKFPIEFRRAPDVPTGEAARTTLMGRSDLRIAYRNHLGVAVDAPKTFDAAVVAPRLILESIENCSYGTNNPEFERALQILETPMKRRTQNSIVAATPRAVRVLRMIEKPKEGEFPAYAHIYIDLLPNDGLILGHLEDNLKATKKLIAAIPHSRLLHRYAEGKWTIKQILGHLIDDERIYVYRALRFARNDSTELPGFDQDRYARYSEADQRDIEGLLDEFTLVRQSTVAFFNTLDDAALLRTGIADGHRVSVRALAYHIAGHELRHINMITERYL
jgi:uncharacterized damage-inducible protein DinB